MHLERLMKIKRHVFHGVSSSRADELDLGVVLVVVLNRF